MPTLEINLNDLDELLGVKLPRNEEKLNEILSYVKGELTEIKGDEANVEVKDSNHPDLWSVEGVARALRGFLGIETGIKLYRAEPAGVSINVNRGLREVRPYIAAAVVEGVKLTPEAIRGLMHLQDKLDQTYGRKRKKTSIGVYDFDLISPPITYGLADPKEASFTPLGFEEDMKLEEILRRHPKGVEYGYIISKFKFWPLLVDSRGKVLSMPPIINSNDLGRVTENTNNVLIEVTGTALKSVLDVLTIMTTSLADRGGKICSVKIKYPYDELGEIETPDLNPRSLPVAPSFVDEVLGIELSPNKLAELLSNAGYGIEKVSEKEILVKVPCYRIDVIHPIDVVEDVAIAYGYNKIPPRWPPHLTKGGLMKETEFYDLLRELMIGFGFQEVLTFSMSNKEKLFSKMNLEACLVAEVSNPKMKSFTCIRNWLIPSLIEFLSNNIHVDYPQKIFEVGECVEVSEERKLREVEKLACAVAHSKANFSEVKSILEGLFSNLGLSYRTKKCEHKSFIEGRVGRIISNGVELGLIGEIHPKVLEEWGLKVPVSAFELDATEIFSVLKNLGKNRY